jgi:glycogen operon protein
MLLYSLDRQAAVQANQLETGQTSETRYGAHLDNDQWIHFAVYAPLASAANLLLFQTGNDLSPSHSIPMVQSGSDWKVKIKGAGIGPGLLYMFQTQGRNEVTVDRPYGPTFNENYFLNDPYAYATQNVSYSQVFSDIPLANATSQRYAGGGKSVVYDHSQDDSPTHRVIPKQDLIVYELHIQDYTGRIDGLPLDQKGTYAGLAQGNLKTPGGLAAGIDHLVELGINAVELLPAMEYDEDTGNAAGKLNHWGYMTTNFFSPEARYAWQPKQHVREFKELIKAFHDRGIAVFMDVVYNHTAEGVWTSNGQLASKFYNFRGLSNTDVYRSDSHGQYANDSGSGNDMSFAGDDSRYTKRLVRDSLALWYSTYGIDGFRFDLARMLAQDSQTAADWVDNDNQYGPAHLHAEPWDNAGQWWDFMDSPPWNYQNNRWAKWLGRYRDKVRKFSKSSLLNKTAFKQLIEGYGSVADLTGPAASTKPWRSINFVTVHDGYTLRDCLYFNNNDNVHNCWDSGGDEDVRRQRSKLLMGILLTSQGVPLILQGDEFGVTKSKAPNPANTYNEESQTGDATVNNVNWIDWKLKDGDNSESPDGPQYGKELFGWTKGLIGLRKQWSHFRRSDFPVYVDNAWNGGENAGLANDGKFTYSWEGPSDGAPTQLGVVWWGHQGEPDLMLLYNESWQDMSVENLDQWSGGDWKILARSWVNAESHLCSIEDWATQCPAATNAIRVQGRSMAILISDND